MKKIYFLFALLSLSFFHVTAQQSAYFDAAQAYNKLLVERGNGSYMRVDQYKVVGTPFFLGEKHKGHLFAKGETAHNILLSYNTYNQELSFYSSGNPDNALVKTPQLVDSFVLKQNLSKEIDEDIVFINGRFIGGDEKSFYRLMHKGAQYSLYKKYKTTLGIVSTNYVQSDLRQFDLASEYYYYSPGMQELKKLKPQLYALQKEFNAIKDVTKTISKEELSINHDKGMRQVFAYLNQ